ncbi:MAG TPA: EamA family transporter [Chitinophagaceae bacterium]|nr:EamA family transporter [Chitinophagaceae bacterium]
MQQATVKEPSRMMVAAAFAAVYIFWGSTYIGIAIAIESTPPFLMAAIRFFAAGLILYVWCIAKGQKAPDAASVGRNAFAGVLLLFCGTTSLIWAEQYLPAGLCSIVVAATPFWFVILDKKNWKNNFSDKFIITGLIVGLAGIVLLSLGKGSINLEGSHIQFISFVVLAVGTILWSAGSLYSKYAAGSGSTGIKASIQMMAAGLFSFIISLFSGEYGHFSWG